MMLGCTLGELHYRMSAAELHSWWIYYQMSPWGDERADIRAGMQSALMVNVWAPKKGSPAKPIDFIPDFFQAAQPKRQTPEEMYQVLLRGTKLTGRVIEPTPKEI